MSEEQRVLSEIVWTPEQGLAQPEVRGISWNNLLLTDDFYGSKWRTDSGVRITADTALQSTVFLACCRILAETIASLPVNVHRRTKNGDEVAHEIPLHKVLSFAPNHWQTKFEFFEQVVMTLCLWGNSYTRIRSGRYGAVSELDNLHPVNMTIERLENGRLRYTYSNPETRKLERYSQDQIMHIRWTAETDGIKGMVPIQIAREAIALARAMEIHAAKFWANSARPGVVLQTDGTLSAESAERLRDNWERIHAGVNSAYKTAVLTGGLKATELGFTNEASQFTASRAAQSEEIARVFRLPLHLVQGQSGGNLEVSGKEFVTYTLMPWLKRIEAAISRSLIYEDDLFYAKFDVRELLRGDSNSRAAYLSTMMNLGIYTLNDARRYEGLPPIGPDGDKHFIAMNVQTLEDAVKPKQDPAAAMAAAGGSPPEGVGGVPSLNEVKTGKPPMEAPKGMEAVPKGEDGKPAEENAVNPSTKPQYEDAVEVEYVDAVEVSKDKKKPKWEDAVEIRSETLSKQNQDLYDAQMKIVAKGGKWPQTGADGAHYMEANPFEARGMACRNCVFFEKPNACHIVEGSIQPGAICKLWVIPEERLSTTESRARSTLSIDFDRTFAANPRLWGEFAKKAVEDGNAVVMISRREDTPEDRKTIEDTLGQYADAFSKVLLVGGDKQKEDAAREAGIKVDVWVDDAPHTIKGESRAFCATGPGGGIDNSCGGEKMSPDDGGSNISGGSSAGSGGGNARRITNEDVAKVLEKISENPQGFTLDPASAEQPSTGIMVSEYANDSKRSVKIKASDIKTEEGLQRFSKWYAENKDLLAKDPTKFVGGWKTGDDFYIDVATRFDPDKPDAALEAGRKAGQLAVFNLGTFKETWVKYDKGDDRKPKEWDSGFARARKDAAVTQVYDDEAPAIQDEDWSSELSKHGHSTVRSYDSKEKEGRTSERHPAIRRADQGHPHRGLPGIPLVPRKVLRGEGRETRPSVVRRRTGATSSSLHGPARVAGGGGEEARRLIAEANGLSGHAVEHRFADLGKAFAAYDHTSDTLVVSSSLDKRSADAFAKSAESGWVSQANPVLHELAHRAHAQADQNSYECSEFISLSDEQRSAAEAEVSRYSATNAKEFVAEVIAGSWSGRKYGQAILGLLKTLTDGKVTLT